MVFDSFVSDMQLITHLLLFLNYLSQEGAAAAFPVAWPFPDALVSGGGDDAGPGWRRLIRRRRRREEEEKEEEEEGGETGVVCFVVGLF